MLSATILTVHLAVIAFNTLGLLIIPIGKWRGWKFVHAPLWRLVHIVSLAITALQAIIGKACFLTDWQFQARGHDDLSEPFVMSWINSLIYWQIPFWVFTVIYSAILLYALSMLWFVPLRHNWRYERDT